MNRFEQLLAGALPTMLASVFLSGEPWVFTAFVAVTSVSALYLVVLGVRGAYRATERNITVRYQRDRRRQADARSANARLGEAVGGMKKSGSPTSEMKLINRLIRDKGILFVAVEEILTPDYAYYRLNRLKSGESLSALRGMADTIASEIHGRRASNERVSVTVQAQPPAIMVTRADRQVLSWSERATSTRPFVAQVGERWSGIQTSLVTIDFTDSKTWNLGTFSGSGGGKSMLLNAAVLSLLEGTPPDRVEFYMIDLDSNQYDKFRRLPHVAAVAEEEEDALVVVEYLAGIVDGNRSMTNTMRRFLVIDELQMMTAQSEFSDEFNRHLATLAQRGRKHGISLATATQDPSGANYPTYLQRNTKVAVAGQTKDDTYLTKYFKIQGASQLRGDGDFISSIHGSFKGFYMPESDITDTIDAICARYGESDGSTLLAGGHLQANRNKAQEVARHRQATMPSPLTPVATAMPRKTKQSKLSKRVERDAEAIAPYMDQAYDEANGRIRDGWAPTLIEAIYGEQKPNAGSYSNRLQAAIRCYNKT